MISLRSFRLPFTLNLFIAFLLFSSQALAQTHTFTALVDGHRHPLPVVQLPDIEKFPFVGIHDLAEALNLRTFYSEKARKVILYFGDLEVKVTALNPFVVVGNRIVQMPIEPRYADGDIFVPLDMFLSIIEPLYHGRIRILKRDTRPVKPVLELDESEAIKPSVKADEGERDREPGREEKAAPKTDADAHSASLVPNILGVNVEQKTNGILLRIKTARPFERSQINSRYTRGWLYIDIYGGRVDTTDFPMPSGNGVIKEIVPVQLPQMAQISFLLNAEVSKRKIYTNPQSQEILISLITKEKVSEDILKTLEREKQKWLIDTIVIDPGHGGRDPGAIGPTGVKEKDVTLAIARYLKKALKKKSDVRVVLTREDDRFIRLTDRTRLANQEQGKLFISIHANSNRSPRVRGITTYILGPAKTEEALEVARRENAVIHFEEDHTAYADFDAENFILLTIAQNDFMQQSQELAALVQSEVTKRVNIQNRGVKQAGYYVLIGASMPNILIEVAFISNRKEERLLKSPTFQKKIAEAICESILKFKRKYEKEM
ncbi:MAG: N-acetylmuramoyl-L-alanine amidase [candidate division KSB1 bacterium]|nr:N-acetylmuramoyl-L-alanine amidase [candidate division KSB1 bacterium]